MVRRSSNTNTTRRDDNAGTRPGRNATQITGQSGVTTQESELTDRPTTAAAPAATANTRSPAASSNDAPSVSANLPAQMEQRNLAAPGVNQPNAFEQYGQQMSTSTIRGTLIKFSKGDWIMGDDEDVPEETLGGLVANMDQLMVGWLRWEDNKPVETIMGPVAEGYQPPRRSELGFDDQSQWEQDNQGRPRDPWQFSNYIILKELGEDASEDNLYTFATSSKGGLNAMAVLCREYGRETRRRPNEYPIVKLGSDSYTHPEYGRTYVPLVKIVGWEDKSLFAPVDDEAEPAQEEQAAAAPPAREEQPRRAAGGRSRR